MIRCKAEWEEQKSVWLSWPHHRENWKDNLVEIREFYVELMQMILSYQPVNLIIPNRELYDEVLALNLGSKSKFTLNIHEIPNNDIWIRDYGPIFVEENKEISIIDFEFNGWGEVFSPWNLDNTIPLKISEKCGYKYVHHSMVLEGGGLDFNGSGVALMTKESLVNPLRNPHLSQVEIENILKSSLGLSEIVWLPHGFPGDYPYHHIDNVARFVSKDHILLVMPDETDTENYRRMQENLEVLKGKKFKITFFPLPKERIYKEKKLFYSYANFIFVNGGIILSKFGCPQDEEAKEILSKIFPEREILSIDSNTLVEQEGGLHCMSKNE